MGDANAIKNGRIGRRIGRRAAGKGTGRIFRRLFGKAGPMNDSLDRPARVRALAVVLAALPVILTGACEEGGGSDSGGDNDANSLADNEAEMSRSDLGRDWPLTVDEGVVSCEGSGGVGEVYFTAEGTKYAVNGLAQGASDGPDIDAIWADDPGGGGLKINIGPIIDRGLELC